MNKNISSYKFHIVVIDDARTNLMLVEEVLKNYNPNYVINTFISGKAGYNYILENFLDIDLLLLDVVMPEISGLDLCVKFRENEKTEYLPIILLTGRTDASDIIAGFNSGADDYIAKPFNSKELNARVNIILKNRYMQKHLEDQNRELKRLNDMKDSFLSIASHDIRNNLTGIIEHCYLILMQKFGALNAKYTQSLKIILKRSKNISTQVDNIIDASRLEAGKLVLNISKTDLNDFLNQYYHDIVTLYTYEEFNFQLENEKTPEVFIDPEKIDEVFTNLVNNAVKYTPKGGAITIGICDYDQDFVLCFVKDTGYGIKTENIPYIFDRFTSVQPNTSVEKKVKSSGLGLSICKGIVETHGGKIWVQSEFEKGSAFYFTLPKKKK